MAKLKTLLVCLAVLAIVAASTLAVEQQKQKQVRRKIDAGKQKKRPQADAPLPSKKKRM